MCCGSSRRASGSSLAGTPLVEIGDPDNLELVVEYLSTDAVKVREGASATVEGWGGPPLTAKVTRVEPAGFTKVSALGIEEQRVRIILALVNARRGGGASSATSSGWS